MGISIAICETECRDALCASRKRNILKVFVRDPVRYGNSAEFEMFLPREEALNAFDDKDGFIKRNRIREDSGTIYLDRLKDPSDRAVLEKITERTYTGWIDLSAVSGKVRNELVRNALPENIQTEWETVSIDETNEICAACELSWDKGRGCVGPFGPENGRLPEIAQGCGCIITASVPDGVKMKRIYTKEDAKLLSEEIPVLRKALAEDGKLAVRRYAGAVDRLDAVARISVREGCGFFFF